MKDLGFENLGFINISICYLSFSINSIFAVKVNKIFGTKCSLIVAACAYAFWMFSYLIPAYRVEMNIKTGIFSDEGIRAVSIISALIIGAGAGPLWVS